jgi:hypothetical protein
MNCELVDIVMLDLPIRLKFAFLFRRISRSLRQGAFPQLRFLKVNGFQPRCGAGQERTRDDFQVTLE